MVSAAVALMMLVLVIAFLEFSCLLIGGFCYRDYLPCLFTDVECCPVRTTLLTIADSECKGNDLTVWVKNDGLSCSGPIKVSVDDEILDGCEIENIDVGQTLKKECTVIGMSKGYHDVRIIAKLSVRASVYCPE